MAWPKWKILLIAKIHLDTFKVNPASTKAISTESGTAHWNASALWAFRSVPQSERIPAQVHIFKNIPLALFTQKKHLWKTCIFSSYSF